MFYLFILILIGFVIINIFIVYRDIKSKKIPNKYLIYLLYLLPTYLFSIAYLSNTQIELAFFIQFFISFIITFLLYYYGIWGAGDAKYLLVLSLFIPHIGIVPFIANISLVTLIYLGLYFVFFYGKNLYNIVRGDKSFIQSILIDFKQRYYYSIGIRKDAFQESLIRLTIVGVLKFLFIFLLIRISKIYIFDPYVQNNYYRVIQDNNILSFLSQNAVYAFLLLFLIIFIFYFILVFCYRHLSDWLQTGLIQLCKIFKVDSKYSNEIILFLFSLLLSGYIYYEYTINPQGLTSNLILIATYYFGILICVKIAIYMYKIAFQVAEEKMIKVSDLKSGDIVDKKFLIKNLGNENCLGAHNNKKGIFYPSPKKYFISMDNPISQVDRKNIQKAYGILNRHHKGNNNFVNDLLDIKILKTFPFAAFIFLGFMVTYFYSDSIFVFVMNIIKTIIKNLYSI